MRQALTDKLGTIAKLRREKPEDIIAQAVEIGLGKMWVDTVLGQYLHKRLSRRRAIQLVGSDLVKLAEEQDKIAQEDVNWGLGHEAHHR